MTPASGQVDACEAKLREITRDVINIAGALYVTLGQESGGDDPSDRMETNEEEAGR
ncbi:hypothetical protein QRX50_35065 [Amycolatopsis carbonis]|uniref:Uncharacterized protein n=1 Tax=Amycolatopsis carbonis TaxID=715471 RepID=A0A9Y2MVE7_9PSEU|nr:hypothetical protein [Amycolatopsis sp. 2-15]WIX76647.1 hypothetical protein QRX50_35065 [Amycolatopsis sp. 2-15]